jgi:hypothetical protein
MMAGRVRTDLVRAEHPYFAVTYDRPEACFSDELTPLDRSVPGDIVDGSRLN